ncbi:MAG: tyrosine recombinase XerC [Oscillospiraceae bacterium]|nr:tyrosine recombinase XerC [Oscillospiraceae bacterium]
MKTNSKNNPEFLNDFLVHIRIVKGLSERTINEYCIDIKLFLKYIRYIKEDIDCQVIDEIDISSMTVDDLKNISISDIYNFIFYLSDERKNNDCARYRKVSAVKSFFNYLCNQASLIPRNPAANLDIPSPKRALPKYLSLSESVKLLDTADAKDSKRDYCIITLFLNCGMRLSELIGLNIADIDFEDYHLKVLGKGDKERIIYLNKACIASINDYMEIRKNIETDTDALFLSNQKKRISKRRVQQIVENTLRASGLDGKGITTHKLRHTAATLMYQYGETDVLTLKEILGHSTVATTEIYTHLSDQIMRDAIENNPLANEKKKK